MSSTLELFDVHDEGVFLDQLTRLAQEHSVDELWGVLSLEPVVDPSEVALACADIAMCAGDEAAACGLYARWLEGRREDSSFLPFTRSRIAAHNILAPAMPGLFGLAHDPDPLRKLIGVGALFALGQWAVLEQVGDNSAVLETPDWRISAAIGFAKAACYDYVNAASFFTPAILQGHGAGRPHNGFNTSITQAAEECAMHARHYTSAMRTAERSIIDRGFEPVQTAAALDLGKIDLFIKTCAKDEQFLVHCLKSIDMFVSGFRRVVLVTDEDHDLRPDLAYDHVVHKIVVPSAPTTFGMSAGYRMQMVVKLSWRDFTDADAVVITDSDTIFTGPFTPERMTPSGKPVWYYGDWSFGILWRSATELVVGAPMPFCCMREHPFIFTREATAGFIEYIDRRFGCSIHDLFFAGIVPGKFCEFEILGGYLRHIASHGYEVLPHQYLGIVKQYWSWGGFTEEVQTSVAQHLQAAPADA